MFRDDSESVRILQRRTSTVTAPSWMLVRLALDTRAHHTAADEHRLTLMEAACTSDYRRYLGRIYGFESAVEAGLHSHPALERLLPGRFRRHHLHHDLLGLGLTSADIERLPVCSLPPIPTLSHALGWLFVVERHTLIAGLLSRQLTRALSGEPPVPMAYLISSSTTPGRRLRELGDALAAHAKHDHRAPVTMVRAAAEGFRCQRQWYLTHQGTAAPVVESATACAVGA